MLVNNEHMRARRMRADEGVERLPLRLPIGVKDRIALLVGHEISRFSAFQASISSVFQRDRPWYTVFIDALALLTNAGFDADRAIPGQPELIELDVRVLVVLGMRLGFALGLCRLRLEHVVCGLGLDRRRASPFVSFI